VAGFASQQCRKVSGGLAGDVQGLTVMATGTARNCGGYLPRRRCDYAQVVEALDQEASWAGVASIAGLNRLHVIDRFWSRADARPSSVTAGTVFWSVFENAIHVALFTP
jgi:hypothetical protein